MAPLRLELPPLKIKIKSNQMDEGFSGGERQGGRVGVSSITFFHLLLDMVFSGLLDVSHRVTRRALKSAEGGNNGVPQKPCASPEEYDLFSSPCCWTYRLAESGSGRGL